MRKSVFWLTLWLLIANGCSLLLDFEDGIPCTKDADCFDDKCLHGACRKATECNVLVCAYVGSQSTCTRRCSSGKDCDLVGGVCTSAPADWNEPDQHYCLSRPDPEVIAPPNTAACTQDSDCESMAQDGDFQMQPEGC